MIALAAVGWFLFQSGGSDSNPIDASKTPAAGMDANKTRGGLASGVRAPAEVYVLCPRGALPASAPGGDYQRWALQDEGVKNLGVLTADADGLLQLQLELRDIAGVLKGFAVSLEPQGGSPNPSAPSGPVVSVGLRVDRS